MIAVKIELDDAGKYTVGIDTADQDAGQQGGAPTGGMMSAAPEGQEDAGMQPVADLEAALSAARDLLTNPQAQAADQGTAPDQMWNTVKRDRQMQAQPGGPMMGTMGR